jgi:hypothetical protein
MKKSFVVPLLLTGALALTACGAEDPARTGGGTTSGDAPTPAELLTKAITASTDQKSAAFSLTASVTGASDDPQVQPFLAKPLKVDISGKASSKAVDISGKANVSGKDLQMAVRADEQQSFIGFMNTWYGPDKGITGATQSTTDPAELKQTLLKLREHANDVLKGEVTEGDEVDGQKTWKFEGTLDPDGIVKVAAAEGKPMDADDQTALRALAPLIKLRFATGQEDGLFRLVGIDFTLTETQIKTLDGLSDSGKPFPLKSLAVNLEVKLSDYGTPVTIETPADVQPKEALGGAMLGAFFSMTG